MTAEEVALRIEERFASGWKNTGIDGFKAGDPKAAVTGIATTWTPTLEVLQQAAKAKQNLIISMQGPFWEGQRGGGGGGGGSRPSSRMPGVGPARGQTPGRGKGPARGATPAAGAAPAPSVELIPGAGNLPGLAIDTTEAYTRKKKFIDDNGLVLWRFSENWQSLPGQYRLRSLVAALGWQKHEDARATESVAHLGAAVFALPATPLRTLAGDLKRTQGWNAVRILGDPAASVSRVVLRPGYMTVPDAMQMVRDTKVDMMVCGEACEWEAFPYFEDWVTAGLGKAFIQLGHAVSEDAGGKAMAGWLKPLFPGVNVGAIACGEPFRGVGRA